ncbi:MAG: hypothetical protein R3326_03995, partial [Gemmatimonadota bacterium]|nr:hypothetical protein [Gemmatimonadota bacterium]
VMADERLTRQEKAAEIERMRTSMRYLGQEAVVAPGMPMGEGHAMSEGSMNVPTRLPDGSWLPQGHPDARRAAMEELMRPMGAPPPREHEGREDHEDHRPASPHRGHGGVR